MQEVRTSYCYKSQVDNLSNFGVVVDFIISKKNVEVLITMYLLLCTSTMYEILGKKKKLGKIIWNSKLQNWSPRHGSKKLELAEFSFDSITN